MGIIKGIFREIRDFFFGLLKQWVEYIFQATGAVTAILVAPSYGKMNAIEPTRDDIAKIVRAAIR